MYIEEWHGLMTDESEKIKSGEDVLAKRIKHQLKHGKGAGLSLKVLANRLRGVDISRLEARLGEMVKDGILKLKKSDRVYNGDAVNIYMIKENGK